MGYPKRRGLARWRRFGWAVVCASSLASASGAGGQGLDQAEDFLKGARVAADRVQITCHAKPPSTGSDGRVNASPLIGKIGGAAAGATGGLGRPVLTVTRLDDLKPSRSRPSLEGSLRWAIDRARAGGGGWITFAPDLEGSLRLEASLPVPSNTTIQGNCGAVEITGAPNLTHLTMTDVRNVIVSGLSFTKDAYDDRSDKTGDAIALTDQFDQVAILHNAFHRCGDGCVDIVRKTRFESRARATVSFNRFANHNKVMLIGTLTCYGDKTAPGCDDPVAHLGGVMEPKTLVTVVGNVFDGTSQRHPKVVSNAAVHLINNLFNFSATAYSTGEDSAVYGAATGGGGVLVAEQNVFVNVSKSPRVGAGAMSAVRAANGAGREPDGVVAVSGNVTVGRVRVVDNQPQLARATPLPALPSRIETAQGGHEKLAACLLRIAGPRGTFATWPDECENGSAARRP